MRAVTLSFSLSALEKVMDLPDYSTLVAVQECQPGIVTLKIAVEGELMECAQDGEQPLEFTSIGKIIRDMHIDEDKKEAEPDPTD